MSNATVIVTGSGGLVGAEAVRHFSRAGYRVVGIDNDMRQRFFGPSASTAPVTERLLAELNGSFVFERLDVRSTEIERVFRRERRRIELIVHTAAQPAHDWAARDPRTDFSVNAGGTLNLLEVARQYCHDATFVYCSTSKVYGARPNDLPLERRADRLDLPERHRYHGGIDTTMSIDGCTHSLFGVSKASADLLVQEYGRYFGMPTVCFRPGCVSGPNHAGAQLHGFLSYLMRCAMTGTPYTVIGYDGLQVRCNIHASDLVSAFATFHQNPRPGAVYNIGGGRRGACSMREAIAAVERITSEPLSWGYEPEPRIGDHRWWISDNEPFRVDYPAWNTTYDFEGILAEIYEQNAERWCAAPAGPGQVRRLARTDPEPDLYVSTPSAA
jgi:CDP-paratose 2-epimerase